MGKSWGSKLGRSWGSKLGRSWIYRDGGGEETCESEVAGKQGSKVGKDAGTGLRT